jgi:hypothetical protein
MLLSSLIVPILALAVAAEDQPITVRGYPWAPFISPMGEPFRGGRTEMAPIARWFSQADSNRDGALTAEEMQADADEWEIAPDVQVNSNWKRPRGQQASAAKSDDPLTDGKPRTDRHDGYRIDELQGAARYGLLNIPQPVASADADFNRAITLTEFRQAAAYRFKLLDSQGRGSLALPELEAQLPVRPEGRRSKPKKNAPDTRVGLPLPEEN